jgi:repressor LexA
MCNHWLHMKPADLKRVREQLGLTQQQMADALRTTRVSVARYEAGMRRIPGMVQVAIDQFARSPEVLMAGTVAAGSPIEPVQQSELIDVPPSMLRGGNTFALRVKGESMKDDGILPGDLVVVRKQETAGNGQTVVALVNNEATIKIYFKKDSHIELRPANATMQPIIVRPSDTFHIEGILIGVIRHCTV